MVPKAKNSSYSLVSLFAFLLNPTQERETIKSGHNRTAAEGVRSGKPCRGIVWCRECRDKTIAAADGELAVNPRHSAVHVGESGSNSDPTA